VELTKKYDDNMTSGVLPGCRRDKDHPLSVLGKVVDNPEELGRPKDGAKAQIRNWHSFLSFRLRKVLVAQTDAVWSRRAGLL